VISKDTIVVSSAAVGAPVKVRYAWANNPLGNLYNGVGLPASPFQTDGAQLPVVLVRVSDARAPDAQGPAVQNTAAALRVLGLESADALGRRFEARQSATLMVSPWKPSL
jgi:hypothetical protein